MFVKIIAILALTITPLSAALWHSSHSHPAQHRFDVTLFKSLRIYLKDGICGMRLLSMPTKISSKTSFHTTLSYNPAPRKASLLINSSTDGIYRVTWFVFPLWVSTLLLTLIGTVPMVRGPVRQHWRRLKGLCLDCGYDLRGNRSGRCPECGNRFR